MLIEISFPTLELSLQALGNDFPTLGNKLLTLEPGFLMLELKFLTPGIGFQMLGNVSQTFGERFKTLEVLILASGNGGVAAEFDLNLSERRSHSAHRAAQPKNPVATARGSDKSTDRTTRSAYL